DLFVADTGNNRIREVDTNGIIHTVAGNGTPTDSGDGGPAILAGIANPWHIALDSNGALYIDEYFSHKVRKVDTGGTISTFAGTQTDRIREVDAATGVIHTIAGTGELGYSGDGGPATSAKIFPPVAMAVDSQGRLYFGQGGIIRMIDGSGVIRRFAGATGGF